MAPKRIKLSAVAIAAGGLAAALAGCGSSGGGGGGGSSATGSLAANAGSAGSGVVAVRTTSLGKVLVTGSGRTIYLLTSDKPNHSNCTGACLSLWPPVKVSSAPSTVSGVSAKLGDAGGQLTVNSWPAYTYAGDTAAGQVHGQGIHSFGGVWWAMSPAGKAVTGAGSSSGSGSGSGSGSSNSSSGGYGGY